MPKMQTWYNDTELEARFGAWWTQEFELREGMLKQEKLAAANSELSARGHSERVIDVKDSEDNLDWQLA